MSALLESLLAAYLLLSARCRHGHSVCVFPFPSAIIIKQIVCYFYGTSIRLGLALVLMPESFLARCIAKNPN